MIKLTTLAKISPKGQITVPVGIRRALGVKEGDSIAFELHTDGRIEVKGLATPDNIFSLFGILQSSVELPDIHELRNGAAEDMINRYIVKGKLSNVEHEERET